MFFKSNANHRMLKATKTAELRSESVAHVRSAATTGSVWARPGMVVIFRAELMPGRTVAERSFRITRVLSNHRVLVEGINGEHTASEFEARK